MHGQLWQYLLPLVFRTILRIVTPMEHDSILLTVGLAALRAGCSLIPIDRETKRPHFDQCPQVCAWPRERDRDTGKLLDSRGAPIAENGIDRGKGSWETFKHAPPFDYEVTGWVQAGAQLAIVAGAVSGGVEVIDIDVIEASGESLERIWCDAAGELIEGLVTQRTGGGGLQVTYRYRSDQRDGNLKLAYLPDPSAKSGWRIAIETRGEGGYFVIAPSLHPSGTQYQMLTGEWSAIPFISTARRRALLDAARALCQRTSEETIEAAAKRAPTKDSSYRANLNGQVSVIDTFNKEHEIEDVLEAAGYVKRGRRYYHPRGGDPTRPGVVILDGRSYHHDSDDPLSDGYIHTAFDVWLTTAHSGDLNAAIKAAAHELGISYEPHGTPVFDAGGWACCPTHGTRLRAGKKSGWYCPARDQSQPRGYCGFWWTGETYTPPADSTEREATDPTPTPPSPDTTRLTQSERIIAQCRTWGYTFRLNRAGNILECNGQPMDDQQVAILRTLYRDAGLKNISALEDTIRAEAAHNSYHPVTDYLDSLVWDGEPRIHMLAKYLHASDPDIVYANGARRSTASVYVYRWMIGAVAKAFDQHQNAMLVLGGPQHIGKSFFVRWLCPLPAYHLEASIQPGERDSMLRFATTWLWEVAEVDATTRRADRSALKAALTTRMIQVRKAYGHFDTRAPALASFIGTFNPDGAGFLDDPTGSRRFWVLTLTGIDRAYSTALEPNHLWAEAVAAYRKGVPWELLTEEDRHRVELNAQHEVEEPVAGILERYLNLRAPSDARMSTADIILLLKEKEAPVSFAHLHKLAIDIGRALKRAGVARVGTGTTRVYVGVAPMSD